MSEITTIRDPNGNDWEFPRDVVESLGFTAGQHLTRAQMESLLHEIMAQVDVSFRCKPARMQ
jgi:hypothetical protein